MPDSSDLMKKTASRKPGGSNFKQQKLTAFQPMLTASNVIPFFLATGVVFLAIGIALVMAWKSITEVVVDYTDCLSNENRNTTCAEYIKTTTSQCTCSVYIDLDELNSQVYILYGLDNYYQNYRQYIISRDNYQLYGLLDHSLDKSCQPSQNQGKPIAPCGAIANSLFNDTFQLNYTIGGEHRIELSYKDIASKTDRLSKYRNPPGDNLTAAFINFTNPPNWRKSITQLDLTDPLNNGFLNQDLMVWMRPAPFPSFRKLYRKVDPDFSSSGGLKNGRYRMFIYYNYPVTHFQGRKKFIITTTSWVGGKNAFLGVAYIVVACLCILFMFACLMLHKWRR